MEEEETAFIQQKKRTLYIRRLYKFLYKCFYNILTSRTT